MYHPNITNLPPPESCQTDWPWTVKGHSLHEHTVDRPLLPKISIVTPSFNQGQYLEETIRSVLLQGYPNLEYIIVDGGSSDNSVEIIQKYQKWLACWTSGPDRGQTDALNRGFSNASGDIFGYINSDDLYEPDALQTIAAHFNSNPGCQLLAGQCQIFNHLGNLKVFKPAWPENMHELLKPFGSTFAQPASFWRREAHHEVGGFDESMHYCFDQEFFLKMGLAGHRPHLVNKILARYRHHQNVKTNRTIHFYEETIPMVNKYAKRFKITKEQEAKLIKRCENEINYLNIFIVWKNSGRLAAGRAFLEMIFKTPTLLYSRKILGQLRRILFFRRNSIAEIAKV